MGGGMGSHLGGVRVVKGGVWKLPPFFLFTDVKLLFLTEIRYIKIYVFVFNIFIKSNKF